MKKYLTFALMCILGTIMLTGCSGGKQKAQDAKAKQITEETVKKYGEKYGVVPDDLNGLNVHISPTEDILYSIDSKYENHYADVSKRWVILNAETLKEIPIEFPLERYGVEFNTSWNELKSVNSYLVCFKGIDKTEWEEKETVPLFFVVVNDELLFDGTMIIDTFFMAEQLLRDADIPMDTVPLPVIHKTFISEYGYRKEIASNETFTIDIKVFTEGHEKTVSLEAKLKSVSGNRTIENSLKTGERIQVAADGSFLIAEGDRSVKGKILKDKITGTATFAKDQPNYSFSATPKD